MTKQDLDNLYTDRTSFDSISRFAKTYSKGDEDLWLFLIDRAYEKTLVWINNGGNLENTRGDLRAVVFEAIKSSFMDGCVCHKNRVYNVTHFLPIAVPVTSETGETVLVEDMLDDVTDIEREIGQSEFLDVVLEIADSCPVKNARTLIEDRFVYGHPFSVVASNHNTSENIVKRGTYATLNYIRAELEDSGIRMENLNDVFDLSRVEHIPRSNFKPVGHMQKVSA